MSYPRLFRGQILTAKNFECIQGAAAIGASDLRVIRRHLLPNVITRARRDPASVLAHTYIGVIQDVRLGGVSAGEYGINAALAGRSGVPVVLVTGDNTVVAQAQSMLGPDLVGVEVKRAPGTQSAVHLHPEKARAAIRAGATQAVRWASRLQPYRVPAPVRMEVDIVSPHLADLAALLPGVARTGSRSVSYEAPDVLLLYKAWRAMLNVMMARSAL